MRKYSALACVAMLCVCMFALAACGGSSSASSAASASASESASSDSASADDASSASSDVASPSASSVAADGTIDQHGNVSLYALIELTGPEVTELYENQGYVWNEKDQEFKREADGAFFFSLNDSGKLTADDYVAATDKGGVAIAATYNVVAGYKDAESALKGNAQCTVEDSYFTEDGVGVAIIYGPSMEEYLVVVDQYGDRMFELDVYSQDAIASGLVDRIHGGTYGETLKEVWKTLTGQDSYGA